MWINADSSAKDVDDFEALVLSVARAEVGIQGAIEALAPLLRRARMSDSPTLPALRTIAEALIAASEQHRGLIEAQTAQALATIAALAGEVDETRAWPVPQRFKLILRRQRAVRGAHQGGGDAA